MDQGSVITMKDVQEPTAVAEDTEENGKALDVLEKLMDESLKLDLKSLHSQVHSVRPD